VVRIVRRADGTSTITVIVGATTIGPVTVPSDATTRVPEPPVSTPPHPTNPPGTAAPSTSTTPSPTSTDTPTTPVPDTQAPDTQTLVPGKAAPDSQTPDTTTDTPTPGGGGSGEAGGAQPPQTTVPGKAPVDGQTPDTQTAGPQTPDTQAPGTQTPDTQTAGPQTPDTQAPGTQTPDTQTPDTQTPDTQTPDTQTPAGGSNQGDGSADGTADGTGMGTGGGGVVPSDGAPGTFEVVPSPGNDVTQSPTRTRSRTANGATATVAPGGAIAGDDAALAPSVVQIQVNLAQTTSDPRATAGWLTAFALGALAAAAILVGALAFRRRGEHTQWSRR
jgi:hypothetical protein